MNFDIETIIKNSKKVSYDFSNDILRNVNLEYSRYFMEQPSYYALLTSIAQLYPDAQYLDLGTNTGSSAVAYAYGKPNKKIYSYDVIPVNEFIHDGLKDIIELRKQDVTTCDFSDIGKIDFIFMDISHNGDDEAKTIMNLQRQGILKDCMVMFDDIHLNKDMERLWAGVESDVKVDITADGHITGTGLILIKD